jgi:YfiH family protein
MNGADAMAGLTFLPAQLPGVRGVRAFTTLRTGGTSEGRYAALNLAAHVGDRPAAVAANRARLRVAAALPGEPLWLRQVHGTAVVVHEDGPASAGAPTADAAVSHTAHGVLAILTADCLPVVLAQRAGKAVALAHAGWRGLAAGVIESAVAALAVPPPELVAWLGPAIGPAAFEVGPEVREAFGTAAPEDLAAFHRNAGGRYQADLVALATRRLVRLGVRSVHASGACTHADPARWYSFRRDGETGRMATLAWLEPEAAGAS